jgi:hypothetical protein
MKISGSALIDPWFLKHQKPTSMPIIGSHAIPSIRWSAIAGHERQAMNNHQQTLEQLASRGGLSVDEAVAIIEDRPWRSMRQQEAEDRLFELIDPDVAPQPADKAQVEEK